MNAEQYFPSDYRAARAAFIAASEARDLGTTARVHPSAKGRDGKPLFLDVATIGARDSARALLMISGTHGVEGYFGSGAQTGLLREGIAPPDGTKIVMLHALNPYGFSWDRRVNEDNADINRNFVDHAAPPENPEYAALADAITPSDMSDASVRAANTRLRAYAGEHGEFALQDAMSRGQYAFPDGLYYGGNSECWSSAMLRDVLQEELRDVEKLVVIDFHTGLGEHGNAEMISEDLPGSPAYARAKAMWGDRVRSSEAGESVSGPLTGTVDRAVAAWMKGVELTFAALEVGTRSGRDVFLALRRDNWLHRLAKGGASPAEAETIRREIRDAFYPDTDEWKRMVWRAAHQVVGGALAALA